MKWSKCYRMDGRIEYVCEHGVGHPDPRCINLIHGCDGCCKHEDFPGYDITHHLNEDPNKRKTEHGGR